jgi:hypothetical protein
MAVTATGTELPSLGPMSATTARVLRDLTRSFANTKASG